MAQANTFSCTIFAEIQNSVKHLIRSNLMLKEELKISPGDKDFEQAIKVSAYFYPTYMHETLAKIGLNAFTIVMCLHPMDRKM